MGEPHNIMRWVIGEHGTTTQCFGMCTADKCVTAEGELLACYYLPIFRVQSGRYHLDKDLFWARLS